MARFDDWAFKVFLCSTLFIVIFSVQAINSWPPLIKSISILTACVLPAGMVILVRGPNLLNAKKVPKEILWVLLIFVFGFISSLVADNQWFALKSMFLFVVSGPLIFLVTLYLFESTRNQNVFLWMTSLGMLGLCFFGIYEHNFNNLEVGNIGHDGILLFSKNPLPAGTLLILLLASPMILLSRERSKGLKTVLSLGLMLSIVLIILLAKKGPLLGLVVVLLLVLLNNRRCLKFLLGFIFLVGFLIQLSAPTFIKYKSVITSKASVSVRFENYFFGLHIFKENPVWGIGFKGNVTQYLDDYEVKFDHDFTFINYKQYVIGTQNGNCLQIGICLQIGN